MIPEQVERLMRYMEERENIRINKESGAPWPWTADKILREFRFTNVRRSDDKTTRAFVKIYQDNRPRSTMNQVLYNCGIFRYFGTIAFAKEVGWQTDYDARHLMHVASSMRNRGIAVFTRAYVITNGGISAPKENVVAQYLGGLYRQSNQVVNAISTTGLWERGYQEMSCLPGFGGSGFMAKEVLQDFLLAYPGVAHNDADCWTPMGPGGRRGINRVMGRPIQFGQPEREFIRECVTLWKVLKETFPGLTAHDVQFNLCEFDKYERTRLGQGKPKNKYSHKEK
jgi:hypothetical protein